MKISFSLLFALLFSFTSLLAGGHHSSGGRTVYPGNSHTMSHGGKYNGETNPRTHKDGKYESPNGDHQYGKHKK